MLEELVKIVYIDKQMSPNQEYRHNDSYLLTPDAQRFLDRFVSLPGRNDMRVTSYGEVEQASLGMMVVHGTATSRAFGRQPRDILRTLLSPGGTYQETHALLAPQVPLPSFTRSLDEFGIANRNYVGRAVTMGELVEVSNVVSGIEAKHRLQARLSIIDRLSRAAIGTFKANPAPVSSPRTRQTRQMSLSVEDWRKDVECVENPELFFSDDPRMIHLAKNACIRCISATFCLEDAIVNGADDEGVRAGMTHDERRQLLKRRR